ncbi:pyrroloquinoline quinone-dependent dehydrogenase, partial [Candidatus Sumerlaeota bacterium]|nr:pyrroloquinoline quinone-dependent dehydrogenase [Candidatus Sumerlaeota bacterium]
PVPTKPPAFDRRGVSIDELIDFTPELRQEAIEIISEFDYGPQFLPPSEKGAISVPGYGGGANWRGAAFDPETGMFYVPSVTGLSVIKLVAPDPARSNFRYILAGGRLRGPQGLRSIFKPPYGRITAYDMNKGEIAWQIPHGDGPRAQVSELVGRDVGPLGAGGSGPLLTKTLLFFGQGAGASARGGRGRTSRAVFQAFDKASGELIHQISLPARPSATPMTYMQDGKQYIVFSAGQGMTALSLP